MEQTLTGPNGHPLLDSDDGVCHLYADDPTRALCGLVLDEWVADDEDDTAPECVVCAALEAASAE